jgi:hypothetical protein
MIEFEIEVKMSVADLCEIRNMAMDPIDVGPFDDLYYRYVSIDGTAPTTGVLTMYTRRTTNEPDFPSAELTLDGDEQTVAIDGVKYLRFGVSTAESGRTGTLHIFARKTQE